MNADRRRERPTRDPATRDEDTAGGWDDEALRFLDQIEEDPWGTGDQDR